MDKEKFEFGVKELKELVLRLHRSAGQLDEMIQNIEHGVPNHSDEMLEFYIKALHSRRQEYLKYTHADVLNTQEELMWKALLMAFEKEEES